MEAGGAPVLADWEGVFAVPEAVPPRCAWCRKLGSRYFAVVFELRLPAETPDVQSFIVCDACAPAGREYIAQRKVGVSHRDTLRDFGLR